MEYPVRLKDVVSIKAVRGGIVLNILDHGDCHFTEEQFICFHSAIRYVVENYDDHIHHHGIGYDVIRPDYVAYGKFKFLINWGCVDPQRELEEGLTRIDQLLGFYHRETEFVYIPPYMHILPGKDLVVCVRRSGMLSLDAGFAFRRKENKRWVEIGRLKHYVEAEVNNVYDDIEPFEQQHPYAAYLADLLGGVTETNSLSHDGYELKLACGLGALELGRITKDDLTAIQKKLTK
ncbi:hypothetical protein pEaSNUABM29_00082 [Erwinia phage pEa_SNUABM_29]|nr:hypothetical protein pEaSNUABM29_00082 [Erwinia phage pEa_SNUABM_29]